MKLKYTKEILQAAVSKSTSLSGVLRTLGFKSYSGGMSNHIRDRIKQYGIDISHFIGKRSGLGKVSTKRKRAEDIFHSGYPRRAHTEQLKRALFDSGIPYECSKCGQKPTWMGKPLTLHVDHVDGDWSNNLKNNLRFLCPNCHSQTPAFGLNRKVGPCISCGKTIQWNSKVDEQYKRGEKTGPFCSRCHSKYALSFRSPEQCKSKEYGVWPSNEKLEKLLWEKPAVLVAKEIGVSSSAVKKRCKRLDISTPSRGYWAKLRSTSN